MPSRDRSLSERWGTGEQAGQVRVRDRGRGLVAGQGDHRGVARAAAEVARPEGLAAEVRPLHQRRSGHDEPVPARRGVRHRGRRRDRPRPGALRAVRRRVPVPQLEPHHRLDLQRDHPQGAQGRVPGLDGAGDPARHRRDQAPHPARCPVGRGGRRDHRDRRHGRRHREPAVPGGDPPVPKPGRPRQRRCTSTARWCPTSRWPAS